MDKKDEALKLALEALEETLRTLDDENAKPGGAIADTIWYSAHETLFDYLGAQIATIREALADSALDRMADNARELGLDYAPIVEQVEDFVGMGHKAWDMVDPKELAKGFHEALAEPPCKTGSQCTNKCQQCEQPAQQEPVAWKDEQGNVRMTLDAGKIQSSVGYVYSVHGERIKNACIRSDVPNGTPLYTSPPASKPWVGLTDEEIQTIWRNSEHMTVNQVAQDIEVKLREKNA